ncbi:quinone-dependent dihydroorotate dehydrogenase [Acaryochloris sp. IP29b_bin.148]|uniref:quinone-dependent dihydroorotate dehydrogenase n=1 Tax=Acaryochloris sp. IP29b_bin.148 TaxID=2969218 RepID=UPI0026198C46|nr:quinone-dependent dihydroorotate dehydrogenase [Acaryochloris sp. IP29b_bin.148]
MDLYQQGLQPLLFSALNADPETVHRQLMRTCAWLDRNVDQGLTQGLQQRLASSLQVEDPRLSQSLWGLSFKNPIGLAAGFDKDGVATNIWPRFGFGFAEVGTVTFHAQPGNPRPRLFRLPADQAALNRMGFNNQGAAAMAKVIAASQDRQARSYPLGINLGKSKVTPLEQAVGDYVGSFRLLKTYGDYFVVNVSSPNTPGLRSLQAVEQLAPILAGLQAENTEAKPLLVKIAPDLEWEDIAAIVDLAQAHQLAGIIATNTTIRRDLKTEQIAATGNAPRNEAGGISGAPVRSRSTEVIRFIHQQTQGQLPIIGVGGIFTAEDAWEKLCAGASLLQVYTGWVYEGPWMVRRILAGLLAKMHEEGNPQLSEIVGQ